MSPPAAWTQHQCSEWTEPGVRSQCVSHWLLAAPRPAERPPRARPSAWLPGPHTGDGCSPYVGVTSRTPEPEPGLPAWALGRRPAVMKSSRLADLSSFSEATVSLHPLTGATVTSDRRLGGPRQQEEFLLTVLEERNADSGVGRGPPKAPGRRGPRPLPAPAGCPAQSPARRRSSLPRRHMALCLSVCLGPTVTECDVILM